MLDFLLDWDSISWKQFKSILRIAANREDWKRKRGKVWTYQFGNEQLIFDADVSVLTNSPFYDNTQRDLDRLHYTVFGEAPRFNECEEMGMTLAYDKNGNRIFLL